MTTVNHWGKWVDSETPVTGVLSNNRLNWEGVDEICLTCEEWTREINRKYRSEEKRQNAYDQMECDSSHDKIFGDWKKDRKGIYHPDKNGEFAAILREDVTQIVYSKTTARGALCSPCYPGQVDLDSTGEFLAYTLPADMLYKED